MNPLISADWLFKNIDDPNLIILDSSPENNVSGLVAEYPTIKIKGARNFNIKKTFSVQESEIPNMILEPAIFSQECQKLGIHNHSKIVVYDNLGIYTSPRVWWMFKIMGHHHISVLNGGLSSWKKKNFPCEHVNKSSGTYEKGSFKAQYNHDLIKNAAFILKNINTSNYAIIDARSEDRFHGKTPEPRENMRGGHIPGSLNLPFKKVLRNGHYLSNEELNQIFNSLNIFDKPVIFTCGSGITACIILLAMELIASNKKSLYDGSWSEWGQENIYPVEK